MKKREKIQILKSILREKESIEKTHEMNRTQSQVDRLDELNMRFWELKEIFSIELNEIDSKFVL